MKPPGAKGAKGGAGKAFARIAAAPIRFYRKRISPNTQPCCRFTPTCSAYALEAIEKHGAAKGLLLAFWRVIRCNPLCRGGYDPVPRRGEWRPVIRYKLYSPMGVKGRRGGRRPM